MRFTVVALAVAACELPERDDFLLGRVCGPEAPCDPGQRCLPHWREGEIFRDFRCRDEASVLAVGSALAYCDGALGYTCPGDLRCGPGRIPADAGPRYPVCRPADGFGPPLEED